MHGWSKQIREMFGANDNMLISVMPERFWSPHESLEHKFSILVSRTRKIRSNECHKLTETRMTITTAVYVVLSVTLWYEFFIFAVEKHWR